MDIQFDSVDIDFTNERVPHGSIVVNPSVDTDVAELIRQIPLAMASEVARWAAWRALGYDATPPADFTI